ncbi:MAG: F0F1 ATP synthase subunit B [Bacteroidales bacterium]|jgi:F-type H+-transporting ATPase subunit b|nr:F0F1 ATP synthase subunit B [Bacteroidales bacterium]
MVLANSLATPALGLIVWTTVIFLIFFYVLRRFAWPQILNAVHARNERIRSSLLAAEKAREEMIRLQADNEAILREAREEKDKIIREARDASDNIIALARDKSSQEAAAIIARAKTAIEREKETAMVEIRQQVASISLEIASRIVMEKLSVTGEQEKLIEKYLSELEDSRN